MTWEGIITTYQKRYLKQLGVTLNIEVYIQSRALKKTLKIFIFENRKGLKNGIDREDVIKRAIVRLVDFLVFCETT